jgi:hypothetical protein
VRPLVRRSSVSACVGERETSDVAPLPGGRIHPLQLSSFVLSGEENGERTSLQPSPLRYPRCSVCRHSTLCMESSRLCTVKREREKERASFLYKYNKSKAANTVC